MKNFLLFFIITALNIEASAQYEAAHWFFGSHAGLDFTSGAPVAEPGSQINTEEGCSSISNACGDLLLYTDGVTVWDANHQVMQNGTGLLGDPSSTQSGIVVPKPDDHNIYYIFTVDAAFGSPSDNGMRYSVVDMRLNGGLGGVVAGQKNIKLVSSASEKVTAVMSSDGNSVWVITSAPRTNSTSAPYNTIGDNMNTIYAFKITSSGVQTTASVTTLPVTIDWGVGYMKASPDGKKLSMANMQDHTVYLLDFDDLTGTVGNLVSLPLTAVNDAPYGLEFSPDSSKLYVSDRDNALTQFDLSNNNASTIISTRANYRSALQLGLDGKIYQPHTLDYGVGSNYMSVIEQPNEAGTDCDYRYRIITLPSNMVVHQGLPPFIQSYFVQIESPQVTAEFTNNLEVSSNEEISSVDWDFGDGTTANSLPDNPPDNTHSHIDHPYAQPGTYTVTAVIHLVVGCDVTVTKTINILSVIDVKETTLCLDQNSTVTTVDLHQFDNVVIDHHNGTGTTYAVKYYTSDTDAYADQNEITGSYTFVTNNDELYYSLTDTATGSIVYGTFILKISEKPQIQNLSTFDYCDNDTDGFGEFDLTNKINEILGNRSNPPFEVTFFATEQDALDDTNQISNPESFVNTTVGNQQIWYRITNTDSGCFDVGSFELVVHPLIDINMPQDYIVCAGQQLAINAPSGFTAYQWSTGETSPQIFVDQAGHYTLTVTNSFGCSNSIDFNVKLSDVARIDKVSVHDFKNPGQNSIVVNASGIGDYEYSMDGTNFQEENLFTGLKAGHYMVYVSDKNGCGMVNEAVDILNNPRFFTPNGDGFNDVWQIKNITARPGSVILIYNRYGKLVKVLQAQSAGWDGTFKGQGLPPDDYWFLAEIKEPNGQIRHQKGHFSLEK